MTHIDLEYINNLDSRFRANFINSLTGYKSCNLIGTCSAKGEANLAIFSSLMHIGSSPALLGFVLRPLTVRRDTFENIKQTGLFTVNQVASDFLEQAHQTAAKYRQQEPEFEAVGLNEHYLDGFKAPYVAESQIKIGCSYKNHYLLEENDCILVIGAVEHIYFPDHIQHTDGFLELDKINTMAAMGQDGYALPKFLGRLSYARPESKPHFIKNGA
ncbi:MAG: flavin reductase [Flavobacteriaceae bacterium]|nr:flavin reductase family protein [Muriicola sp.]NNL40065.1 flavin reductase [Flavobacteriaceae bacterium]